MNKDFTKGYIVGGLIVGGVMALTAVSVIRSNHKSHLDLMTYVVSQLGPHVEPEVLRDLLVDLELQGIILEASK